MNGNLGIPNSKFYNNTFYHSPYTDGSYSPIVCFNQPGFHATGGVVVNNLFVNNGFETPEFKLGSYSNGSVCSGDYNLVVGMPPTFSTLRSSPSFSDAHGLNGVDPIFVDPENGDFRLQAGSPAIGAGTALNGTFTTDYNGVTRGASWDIGAYEYYSGQPITPQITPPVIPPIVPPTPIIGDFNADGVVNSIDLSLMIIAWNTSNTIYDLNRDGIVNSLDYVVMVRNWTV